LARRKVQPAIVGRLAFRAIPWNDQQLLDQVRQRNHGHVHIATEFGVLKPQRFEVLTHQRDDHFFHENLS
jgi:hypothetical protein